MEDDFNDFSELSAGDTSIALRRCFAQVAAERDQLRAEVEDIRQQRDYWQEEAVEMRRYKEASEALVAGLRGALDIARVKFDWIRQNAEPPAIDGGIGSVWRAAISAHTEVVAALALTPASAGARLKGETLREAADSVPEGADAHDWFYMLAEKYTAEAEQEAANGR